MKFYIKKANSIEGLPSVIVLADNPSNLPGELLTQDEINYINNQFDNQNKSQFEFNKFTRWIYIQFLNLEENTPFKRAEKLRKAGDTLASALNEQKSESVTLLDCLTDSNAAYYLLEGLALGSYQFLKYQTKAEEKRNTLKEVSIISRVITQATIDKLNHIVDAVWMARNLVNEPNSTLTATRLADALCEMAHKAGIKVEVFNQNKIEALKMGGLLAVNRGSEEPATFTVMEYNPQDAVNKQPLVLVGKGIVFDTGGNSLKPTSAMKTMKSDMAGAAVAGTTLYAVAQAHLPIYVIALIPATDNRINSHALVPDDIVTISDGTTVEILNTDAEGRLILADALAYAKKYDPMLVIDLATLTGSATAAIGSVGAVAMHVASDNYFETLSDCGFKVNERLVPFPMWDDYAEMIKSDIADIKQSGGKYAGSITAAKFLEHFTDYPWIHIDMAGTAFTEKRDSYRGLGGTAFGVRLLFDFIKELSEDN
ncbi:MAG: leucyl aminopeptidase [Bacteroidota bacterium]|nr:leucyl aminopeptidase [Bacteroidota bacterium]